MKDVFSIVELISGKGLNRRYEQLIQGMSTKLVKGECKRSSIKCPECHKYFLLVKIDEQELDFCKRCNSFWFDAGELKHFTNLFKDVPGENLKSRWSKYRCPVCDVQMREYAFLNLGNLLVDKCPTNHGVYLESGEFIRALNLSRKAFYKV